MGNVCVTTKQQIHTVIAATDIARPRTRLGKISEQRSQPMGPVGHGKRRAERHDAGEQANQIRRGEAALLDGWT